MHTQVLYGHDTSLSNRRVARPRLAPQRLAAQRLPRHGTSGHGHMYIRGEIGPDCRPGSASDSVAQAFR